MSPVDGRKEPKMEREYEVHVEELVHMVLTVKAGSAREAGELVKKSVRPSGVYRRTIKRITWLR